MGFKIGLAKKRKKRLEKELNRLIPKIINMNVEKIILFGSLLSDDVHKSSDIDLIIVKRTKKRFLDRIDEFHNYLDSSVAIDIFVYTPREFDEMKEKSSFIKSVLNSGRIIYEK